MERGVLKGGTTPRIHARFDDRPARPTTFENARFQISKRSARCLVYSRKLRNLNYHGNTYCNALTTGANVSMNWTFNLDNDFRKFIQFSKPETW